MASVRVKNDKCLVCSNTVYTMDKMVADGKVFHKTCMRCTHCEKVLGLGNFAALNGKYYCKPHFKQLFQEKGNYSDGFGEEKPTAKWAPQVAGYALGTTPGANFGSPTKTKSKPVVKKDESPKPIPVNSSAHENEVSHTPPEIVISEPEPDKAPAVVISEPPKRKTSYTVEDIQSPKLSLVPASPTRTPVSPGSIRIKNEKCQVCEKVVYNMDKMVADGIIFHKTCMRCAHCEKVLGLGNFAALNGKYYCKPHFKQLFQEKGNYSDGFGEAKPTAKWEPQVAGYALGQKKFF